MLIVSIELQVEQNATNTNLLVWNSTICTDLQTPY